MYCTPDRLNSYWTLHDSFKELLDTPRLVKELLDTPQLVQGAIRHIRLLEFNFSTPKFKGLFLLLILETELGKILVKN